MMNEREIQIHIADLETQAVALLEVAKLIRSENSYLKTNTWKLLGGAIAKRDREMTYTSTQRTEGPWRAEGHLVRGPNGERVATVKAWRPSDSTDFTNAEYIVRAVNSHEDLLEALKAVVGCPNDVALIERARDVITKVEERE